MEFTQKESEFFRPLISKNARFYFECALKLIERSKEMPVLYERDAKEIIAAHMRQIRYTLENETDSTEDADPADHITSGKGPAENVGAVIARFRKAGWIAKREIGRNGENLATITGRCRKVIETINRVFHPNENGAITNHIFSIYEILYSALEWQGGRQIRPYTNVLEPLIDHEFDLKEELTILRDSISSIMNEILKLDSATGLGSYMVKDELLNRFFRDYFFMKKGGTIPGTVAKINVLLARISTGDLYESMISECENLKDIERFEAKNIVDAQLSELEYFLNHGYDEQMSVIDEKVASYYNLYAARISMIRNNNMNTQNYLNQILMDLKDMAPEAREEALSQLSDSMRIMSYKLIGKKSFERRITRRNVRKEQGELIDFHVDEDDMETMTDSLYGVTKEKYGIDAAKNHIRRKFATGRKIFSVKDEPVESREEALLLASAVIFSGADDFPYVADFDDHISDHGVAEMSDFVIKPKEKEKETEISDEPIIQNTEEPDQEEETGYGSDSL